MDPIIKQCQRVIHDFFNQPEKHVWSYIAPSDTFISSNKNEFLLLIKPEIFEDQNKMQTVFQEFNRILTHFDTDLAAIKIMTKKYITANNLIDKNYPTLSLISKKGWDGLHPVAKKRVLQVFPAKPKEFLGGDQALQMLTHLTPTQLCEHCDSKGTTKLGSGIYACYFDSYVLLDGFFPYQRYHLSNGLLIACVVRSRHSWNTLRYELVGAIDPSKAALGSLRRTFHDLNLGVSSIAKNGFHISPGPLEAAWQIMHFFFDTNFNSCITLGLEADGMQKKQIRDILSNPLKGNQPLFELTEGLDTDEALAYV